MEIEILTGKLSIGNIIFEPGSKIEGYTHFLMEEINPASGFKCFVARKPEPGISVVSCFFKNEAIQWVGIYLEDNEPASRPFEVSERQRELAYERVEELGGEQSYVWGEVTVSEDRKGGVVSINISYTKHKALTIGDAYEQYKQQYALIRQYNHYGRPRVLKTFRYTFCGFSQGDIVFLKQLLKQDESKWFVAELLESLESFPEALLEPMLEAAVNEPDPSFNKIFVQPCRRVLGFEATEILLLRWFREGDCARKISIIKAFYWNRPTVFSWNDTQDGVARRLMGRSEFWWDPELLCHNEEWVEDADLYNLYGDQQQALIIDEQRAILEAFVDSDDVDLLYHLLLRLPKRLEEFYEDNHALAQLFLDKAEKLEIDTGRAEHGVLATIKSAFWRRMYLKWNRIFRRKDF